MLAVNERPSAIAKDILGKLAILSRQGASADALLLTVQLLSRKMTTAKDDRLPSLDWDPATCLFSVESLCAWNASSCRHDRFLKTAFQLLLTDDESGAFGRTILRGRAATGIDPTVKALLLVWGENCAFCLEPLWGNRRSIGYGSGTVVSDDDRAAMQWVDDFLTLASDSPAVSCLLSAGDPVVEGIIKNDGIYRGSRNLTALVLRRLTKGVLIWLCLHECYRTLAYIVETRTVREIAMPYEKLIMLSISSLREHRKRDNGRDLRLLFNAVNCKMPGILADYVDQNGNTLFWPLFRLAMSGRRGYEVAIERSKIMRDSGFPYQKANVDGISWENVENEIRQCQT